MPKVITLEIPGLPVAKQRHRTGKGKTYNPQSEVERAIQWEMKKSLPEDYEITRKPLMMALDAYFPRPMSHYGTGKNEGKLKPSAPKFHTNKPDMDNTCKIYMDCMNKLVYLDDTQVVGFDQCGKRWIDKDLPGRVEIRLRELSD